MFAWHGMYTEIYVQYLSEYLNSYGYICIFLYDLGKYCIFHKEPFPPIGLKIFIIFSFKNNLEAEIEWAAMVKFPVFNSKIYHEIAWLKETLKDPSITTYVLVQLLLIR